MVIAQDGNRNIFAIDFPLVEGETSDAWSFPKQSENARYTPTRTMFDLRPS